MTSASLQDLPFYSPVHNSSLACMQVVMWWKIIKLGAAGGKRSEPPACVIIKVHELKRRHGLELSGSPT